MTKTEEGGSFVYTPAESATTTLEYLKRIQADKERSTPLPKSMGAISSYFAPVYPRQMVVIIGQTSHGKSLLTHFIERETALAMSEQGRHDECLIHISVEEDIEEQGMLEVSYFSGERISDLARGTIVDWDMVLSSGLRISTVPIYRIGVSSIRPGLLSEMHLSRIAREIQWAKERFNLKISGMFFDYLQAFPMDPEVKRAPFEEQRRLQVRADVYRLREAGKAFDCPIWVDVQAKQKLEHPLSAALQIPGIYDGEETGAIAQRADRGLAVWMPKMTYPIGKVVTSGEFSFKVEEDDMFIRVVKQRGNLPSGRVYRCKIDYNTYSINVFETANLNRERNQEQADLQQELSI